MIDIQHLVKHFDDVLAVDDISIQIPQGAIFGLIGTNGAGKSTFLRLVCGILKPERGQILIDGLPVFENPTAKARLFYIADEPYYFHNARAEEVCHYYAQIYPRFDRKRCQKLCQSFGLDLRRKVNTYSKGMKKQLFTLCAIAAGTEYILCDETFDGLDPVMRQAVKSLFAGEVAERQLTLVIASHNLREIEDICDQVGLLHKGATLFARDLQELRSHTHKVQVVFNNGATPQQVQGVAIERSQQSGAMYTLLVRGEQQAVEAAFAALEPLYLQVLPLSLEEAFINETEAAGYAIKDILV